MMNNYERIKNLSLEEMAEEIKAIANWDRKEKRKAEKDSQWYIRYLKTEIEESNQPYEQIKRYILEHHKGYYSLQDMTKRAILGIYLKPEYINTFYDYMEL
jgi:hypothetical protein